ncbi:hypothetical protein EVAR_36736_1 [Eumeta japonica]|uniref:Uncharacterized protein n=1 Tax=Eumeta variegata TaxID=151549 RepID=A0A4C1X3W4_EUMVA|nr:hypothetical protein EVAR_36736_1 [Eumeta japonica]
MSISVWWLTEHVRASVQRHERDAPPRRCAGKRSLQGRYDPSLRRSRTGVVRVGHPVRAESGDNFSARCGRRLTGAARRPATARGGRALVRGRERASARVAHPAPPRKLGNVQCPIN